MSITIEKTKIELINWLTTIDDAPLLSYLSSLKSSQADDWWETISDAEKHAILAGKKDVKDGKTVPHETVKKIYEQWL